MVGPPECPFPEAAVSRGVDWSWRIASPNVVYVEQGSTTATVAATAIEPDTPESPEDLSQFAVILLPDGEMYCIDSAEAFARAEYEGVVLG